MQDTSLPWLVLQLTHSPAKVGLLVFCRYVPFLVLGLFSGTLADRLDNRRLLICTQSGQLVTAATLAALAF
jgi:MFS family permease